MSQRRDNENAEPIRPVDESAASRTRSRRSFLKDVGRKAAYVTPIVMTLAATEARAGSKIRSWCGDVGSPCQLQEDCCPELMCNGMVGMELCQL